MTPPYVVLVTGSSKGVGRALAEEFLRAGDSVVVCARNGGAVDEAVAQLRAAFGAERVAVRSFHFTFGWDDGWMSGWVEGPAVMR